MADGVNNQSTDISFIAFDFVEDNNADILPENVDVEIVATNIGTSSMYFNGENTCKLYIGSFLIERMYLGDILIYDQPADDVQIIDNTLYITNVDMDYNEEEKTLYVDENNLNYDDEQHNLRIEGDE